MENTIEINAKHFEAGKRDHENGYYDKMITLNIDAYNKASYWMIPFLISLLLSITLLIIAIANYYFAKDTKKEMQK